MERMALESRKDFGDQRAFLCRQLLTQFEGQQLNFALYPDEMSPLTAESAELYRHMLDELASGHPPSRHHRSRSSARC